MPVPGDAFIRRDASQTLLEDVAFLTTSLQSPALFSCSSSPQRLYRRFASVSAHRRNRVDTGSRPMRYGLVQPATPRLRDPHHLDEPPACVAAHVVEATVGDHDDRSPRVVDVSERVALEQYEVGQLPHLNSA